MSSLWILLFLALGISLGSGSEELQRLNSRKQNDAVAHTQVQQRGGAGLSGDRAGRAPRQTGRAAAGQRARASGSSSSSNSPERTEGKAANTKRLSGPHVCGGQCCSGWAIAPGTHRCIKPDCQPPCENRGSCSRPQTCVCRSGYQGARCEELAPEQVYIRTGTSRVLIPYQPGPDSSLQQPTRRRPTERQTKLIPKTQTPKPPTSRVPHSAGTQVRRGSPDITSQQTGSSRTVKRFPSSSAPITSNSLPNGPATGNEHIPEHTRTQHDSLSNGYHHPSKTVSPAGANLTASVDRIKIVFTPTVCKRVCDGRQCYNSCERGDKTTVYSESQGPPSKSHGFRLFFCQIECLNGGRCIGQNECWCPSNSTGKFCHITVPIPSKPTLSRQLISNDAQNGSSQTIYTLPLSNQQVALLPSLVKVHVQHPPEAEVQIHQVAQVRPGQAADTGHSVQQRSQPANGQNTVKTNESEQKHLHGTVQNNGQSDNWPHTRQNGHVGRCFQETVDGKCGNPLPGLTKQDDCCGSVGASWGINKCTECPSKPAYAVIANGQVECPKGYKRMNSTHCQDINECVMPGICKHAVCLNTKGSYRCTCKPGYMLDPARSHCVSDKAMSIEKALCYRSTLDGSCSLPLTLKITKQICCCSRVGKAWGPACERCPLPDSDHFREICPAGHGYTYSRSDIQIKMRELGEEERTAVESSNSQIPKNPSRSGAETPYQRPQIPANPETSYQRPRIPTYPDTSYQQPHLAINPDTSYQRPQIPTNPETSYERPQIPTYPGTSYQQPQIPINPDTSYYRPQIPTNPETHQRHQIPASPESPYKRPQIPTNPENPYQRPQIPLYPKTTQILDHPETQGHKLLKPSVPQATPQPGPPLAVDPVEDRSHLPTIVKLDPEAEDTAQVITVTEVTDIDMCSASPRVCGQGQCVSVQGGYTCYCDQGYTLNPLQTTCIDVNECEKDPCGGKGRCVNTIGSYTCQCFPGYSLLLTQNTKSCQDVNECAIPNKCPGGVCVNTEGSFRCECKNGFFRNQRGQCEDVDECTRPGLCPGGECVNTQGSFQCQACGDGFSPVAGRCLDVDECLLPNICAHGSCHNLPGSYICSCNTGYKRSPEEKSCLDVNECLLPEICAHGTCDNLPGSYICNCNTGYQNRFDGKSCVDVNECLLPNICAYGKCDNFQGSYTCRCNQGYQSSPDGKSCVDLDECQLTGFCTNGQCLNTEGSFTCACNDGYQTTPERNNCTDVDECLLPDICVYGSCRNLPGSYICSCNPGYQGSHDDKSCVDVDECAEPSQCDDGVCANTAGSFTCTLCKVGFTLSDDRQQCDDIDECLSSFSCPNAICFNSLGSFECAGCPTGFSVSEDRKQCEDIDECLTPGICSGCPCYNTKGSYNCRACEYGMSLAFSDINECEDPEACLDGIAYKPCSTGYTLNGSVCTDVNECLSKDICGVGTCWNTPGSFRCICPPGSALDQAGASCQDVDECAIGETCSNGQCFNSEGSYLCVCAVGYRFSDNTRDCEDLNECKENKDLCRPSDCKNTLGSYQCIESQMHVLTIVDMDECEMICGKHGFCEKTNGTYSCQCDLGYTNPPEGQGCIDINECESSRELCGDAQCENVEGTFLCLCVNENEEFDPVTSRCMPSRMNLPAAFDEDQRKECYYNLNDANFCDNVLSRNVTKQECCCTVGAGWGDNCEFHPCPQRDQEEYNWLCPQGSGLLSVSVPDFNGPMFKDADECLIFGEEVCKGGFCLNTYSSFSCYCHNGYYYDTVHMRCVDNDECLEQNYCEGGKCVNTLGSFNCFCSPPLVLDGTQLRCISVNGTEENVHTEICWQNLNYDTTCIQPLTGASTTYTECCCLHGVAWGPDCALCPERSSGDFALLCNLPQRGSLQENPGFEYGPDSFQRVPYERPYWNNNFRAEGETDYSYGGTVFGSPSEDYSSREAPLVPLPRPWENQPPRRVDPYRGYSAGFEGLQAEECGILNGCENGRCVRVREGYTCDCFDGYELSLSKMACIDINECEDISDNVELCKNGVCSNTEGSYKCTCLPGYLASSKPHECVPEDQVSVPRPEEK